jgi:predicted hydrocarbon binding protein
VDIFHHYMRRLSQRGWGQFKVVNVSPDEGLAEVKVSNSAFVDEERRGAGRKLCYMFAAWLEGSLEYVAAASDKPRKLIAREVSCAAEGNDHCTFKVEPAG